MTLDTVTLSRLQFAFTIAYHIMWPAYSIGIAGFIVLLNASVVAHRQDRLSGTDAFLDPALCAWLRHGSRHGGSSILRDRRQLERLFAYNWQCHRPVAHVRSAHCIFSGRRIYRDRSIWRSASWAAPAFFFLLHGDTRNSAKRILGPGRQ